MNFFDSPQKSFFHSFAKLKIAGDKVGGGWLGVGWVLGGWY